MSNEKILIVDDESGMRNALREVLKRLSYTVDTAEDAEEGLRLLEENDYSLIMSDVRMPEMDGIAFLENVMNTHPEMRMIMMTAYGTIEDAVTAMKKGAMDYLLKPFSLDSVEKVVSKCLHTEKKAVKQEQVSSKKMVYCVAQSGAMKNILRLLNDVAPSPATVLIEGESGTGKEVLARMIHNMSGRGKEGFVAVNCAAIPEGLLESELFGHEKGAFTGAVLSRKGKFEQAHKGTMLLDEISEMPLSLQAKLLRVIQEREIEPVGGKGPVSIDVRIVATTNRNLEEEVRKGNFREDLFYRLNVIRISIPPLRERKADLAPLAQYFMQKYTKIYGRNISRMNNDFLDFVQENLWRGNVRELENFIEKAVLLSKCDELTLEGMNVGEKKIHIPVIESFRSQNEYEEDRRVISDSPLKSGTLEEMEKNLIHSTLEKVEWNRTKAAELLGVSVRTVRNKITYYNIDILQKSKPEMQVIENVG